MWWFLLLVSLAGLGYLYMKNVQKLKPRGMGFKVAHTPKEDTLHQLEVIKKQEEAEKPEKALPVEKILGDALAALENNNDAEAEKFLLHVISLQDRNPEANQKLGMLYLKNGLASKAEPFLRVLTEEETNNASHLSNLGYALFMQNRLTEAKEAYEEALSLDSSRSGRFASLAQVHMALKEFEIACGLLKKALSMEKNRGDFMLLLAECHYHLEQFKEAMSMADSVLGLDSQNEEAKEILRKIRNNSVEKM